MRIAVGLSGGIDSSVAAFLLKKAGNDVAGIMMALWPAGREAAVGKSGCYGPGEAEDIEAARRVCAHLDIPFSIFDCSKSYEDLVLRYFRDEYRGGRTPNPCVRCNQLVKFGLLPQAARESGLAFDYFATGHYARVERDPLTGRYLLKRGVDARKDQSYFLYRLSQDQLAAALFPLGGMMKTEARRIAREAGLPVHDRKESQDFYGGDLNDILRQEDRDGEIVDRDGKVLGRHTGVWNYTIGQRKGLGIAFSVPLYVTAIDAENNRLVVGPESEALRHSCLVAACHWIVCETPDAPFEAAVKIRSSSRPVRASISPLGGRQASVVFDEPILAVTPGQSAVFYKDDTVLGGGVIESTE